MDQRDQFASGAANLRVRGLHDDSGDARYWLAQSPARRLEAMAFLRRQYFEFRQQPEPGLQRVLKIISLEHLKRNKKATGRVQDLLDLENLP